MQIIRLSDRRIMVKTGLRTLYIKMERPPVEADPERQIESAIGLFAVDDGEDVRRINAWSWEDAHYRYVNWGNIPSPYPSPNGNAYTPVPGAPASPAFGGVP